MTREELIEIINKAGLPSFNHMYVIVEIEEIAKLADLIIEAYRKRDAEAKVNP